MAYGGTPIFVYNTQLQLRHFVRIDGLTLDSFIEGPLDIGKPDTGQITTGIPDKNQIGLPNWFGRGRGNWRPEDADLVTDDFTIVVDGKIKNGGFAVPVVALPSPVIIDGNLVLTRRNIAGNGGDGKDGKDPGKNPQLVRLTIQIVHSYNS